jgi:hypothetical protein
MGSVSVSVRLRKRAAKWGGVGAGADVDVDDDDDVVVVVVEVVSRPRPSLGGGGRSVKLVGRTPGHVASRTCMRSSRNCASSAPSDCESLCPAQLMRRRLRSTAGTMWLLRRRANVRVCSSGTDVAGGVMGGGVAVELKSKPEPEDCWRVCESVGDERESWLTNASADFEKTKPRCWSALVTVWRARDGTRM